jgi:hypothetical protein
MFTCCKEHKWARLPTFESLSGKGKLSVTQCNDCLSLKIKRVIPMKNSVGEWEFVESLEISVPSAYC